MICLPRQGESIENIIMATESSQTHHVVSVCFTKTGSSFQFADKKFTIIYDTRNIYEDCGITIIYTNESEYSVKLNIKPAPTLNLTLREFAHLSDMLNHTASDFSSCGRLRTKKEYISFRIVRKYPGRNTISSIPLNIADHIEVKEIMSHVLDDINLMTPYLTGYECDNELIVDNSEVYKRLMIAHARDTYERLVAGDINDNQTKMEKQAKQALDQITLKSFKDFLKRSNLKADGNMRFKETINSITPQHDIVNVNIYPTRGWFIHNARCEMLEVFMNHIPRLRESWTPCPKRIDWSSVIMDEPNCQLWVEVAFEDGSISPQVKIIHDKGFIKQFRGSLPTSYMRTCFRNELKFTLDEIKWFINPDFVKYKEGHFGTLTWQPMDNYISVKFANTPLEKEESIQLDLYEQHRLYQANIHIFKDLDLMLPYLRNKIASNVKIVTEPEVLDRLYQAYVKFLYNNILTLSPIDRARKVMSYVTLSGFREFLNHSGLDCRKDFSIDNQPFKHINLARCYFPSQTLFIHNATCQQCSRAN